MVPVESVWEPVPTNHQRWVCVCVCVCVCVVCVCGGGGGAFAAMNTRFTESSSKSCYIMSQKGRETKVVALAQGGQAARSGTEFT